MTNIFIAHVHTRSGTFFRECMRSRAQFVEKQAAEQELMPMVPNEAIAYGYQDEDRHMVESFLKDEMPEENWRDGLQVARLMMTAYKSAEEGKKLIYNPKILIGYKPKVASGDWRP